MTFVIKKIYSKIYVFTHRVARVIYLRYAPKVILSKDTILINKDVWKTFDSKKFSDKYAYYTGSIASLAPESLNMIVAIVGANVSMQTYLKSMNRLAWVQTASHGANGFDNKDIYASEVKVTTVKDVYAEPISNFCIASYYTFFSYSYRRIIRGFRDFTPPPS